MEVPSSALPTPDATPGPTPVPSPPPSPPRAFAAPEVPDVVDDAILGATTGMCAFAAQDGLKHSNE